MTINWLAVALKLRRWQFAWAWVLGVALVASACAAKTPVARLQVSALAVGEAVLAIDQAERDVYRANLAGYDKADHDRIGAIVLKLLYAARGFERAVATLPASATSPSQEVLAAQAAVLAGLDDLTEALPAAERVRAPMLAAAAGVRAALVAWNQGGGQ